MKKKRLSTARNRMDFMYDSDPDIEDSDTESSDESPTPSRPSTARFHPRGIQYGGRGVPLKRSKSRKKLKAKSKSIRNIQLSHTSADYDESDYGAPEENKTVQQLIEEHYGMYHIKEAEKLENDGFWEKAAVKYETGVSMLQEYQKELNLSTKEKRTYRQELAEYRRKMLLVQNRLIRKSNRI